jgi:DNA-binding SARP family transcriptional activator
MAPTSPGPHPERSVHFRRPSGTTEDEFRLSLLGAFELSEGAMPIVLPAGSQRLLAFLGIRDRAVTRDAIAGTLWPDASEEHARASLRTLLSRLDARTRSSLHVNVLDLSLSDGVAVDLRDSTALAHRLLIVAPESPDVDLSRATIEALASDLLPDWYDEWVVGEAAQWHELRVRALEALSDKLTSVGRYPDAMQAANLAIAAEPLRESARATLIRVYQAEGKQQAAWEAFEQYRSALRAELDSEPTPALRALAAGSPQQPEASSVMRQVQTAAAGEETRAFEVVASGISMEPSIRHGDKLLVSQDIGLEAGRVVIATHQGVWIVKRLMLRDGVLVLRSDNADEEVALADVDVKGVVVEIRRTI